MNDTTQPDAPEVGIRASDDDAPVAAVFLALTGDRQWLAVPGERNMLAEVGTQGWLSDAR